MARVFFHIGRNNSAIRNISGICPIWNIEFFLSLKVFYCSFVFFIYFSLNNSSLFQNDHDDGNKISLLQNSRIPRWLLCLVRPLASISCVCVCVCASKKFFQVYNIGMVFFHHHHIHITHLSQLRCVFGVCVCVFLQFNAGKLTFWYLIYFRRPFPNSSSFSHCDHHYYYYWYIRILLRPISI